MGPPRRLLSVVIPTLNEEHGLGATLDAIPREALAAAGWDLEVIVVDGDSRDATRSIAHARGCRVILEPRKGYGRAYKTGLALARGEMIATGDADGTYPFGELTSLLRRFEERRLDFLTGDRFGRLAPGAMGPKHRFGNWVLSTAFRLLFWRHVHDSQSGMWLIRRAALARFPPLERFHDGMPFSEEIKAEAFLRRDVAAAEVPIPYAARLGEAKIQSFRDGLRNLWFLLVKRLRFRRSAASGRLPATPAGPWREEPASRTP